MSTENVRKRRIEPDAALTSLTFTDVIFGLVFTKIFMRASALGALPIAIDVHLGLALVVAAGSYIGYRGSLKRACYKLAFFNLPLIRFTLDLFMIFLYYVLTVIPNGPKHQSASVNPRTDSAVLFFIFVAYMAWDLVSKYMYDKGYTEISFQWKGALVTFAGVVSAGTVLAVTLAWSRSMDQNFAIIVDSVLIGLAILYRWVKNEITVNDASQSGPKSTIKVIEDSVEAINDAAIKLKHAVTAAPSI